MTSKVLLSQEWVLGKKLGEGGFGAVYLATSGDTQKALKLVKKHPHAKRELLFVDLSGVRNVVPVEDVGETDDEWALLMPLAQESLHDRISLSGSLSLEDTVVALKDVAETLCDLASDIVHRDLKPRNILWLNGHWCLSDFGIARYAEATTESETLKGAFTAQYCAPERWRYERATSAADVYSFGIIIYELLVGVPPFQADSPADYRNLHLHEPPPPLGGAPPLLQALYTECLYKAPEARPSPENILSRLEQLQASGTSKALDKLRAANLIQVERDETVARTESIRRTREDQHQQLYEAAEAGYQLIRSALEEQVRGAAPAVRSLPPRGDGVLFGLAEGRLGLSELSKPDSSPWGRYIPAFTVIASACITVSTEQRPHGYAGRSHSLWYCDAAEAARFGWYETAFMFNAFSQRSSKMDPFCLPPGPDAGQALWVGLGTHQVAWPFQRIDPGDPSGFSDKWLSWFADAARGALSHPNTMPEHNPQGSWRTQ